MMAVLKRLNFHLKDLTNANDNGISKKIWNHLARKIKINLINNQLTTTTENSGVSGA